MNIKSKDVEYASLAMAMCFKALQERFSDKEIRKMFTREKVNAFLKILNERDKNS